MWRRPPRPALKSRVSWRNSSPVLALPIFHLQPATADRHPKQVFFQTAGGQPFELPSSPCACRGPDRDLSFPSETVSSIGPCAIDHSLRPRHHFHANRPTGRHRQRHGDQCPRGHSLHSELQRFLQLWHQRETYRSPCQRCFLRRMVRCLQRHCDLHPGHDRE